MMRTFEVRIGRARIGRSQQRVKGKAVKGGEDRRQGIDIGDAGQGGHEGKDLRGREAQTSTSFFRDKISKVFRKKSVASTVY